MPTPPKQPVKMTASASDKQVGEANQLALALAHVLESVTHNQAAKYGDDLVELIDLHVSEPGLGQIANPSKPTPAELRQIGKALCHRHAHPTNLDRRLGWLCEKLGFDKTDLAILGALARCSLFDGWRALVRILPPWSSAPTATKLALLSGLPTGLVDERLAPHSSLRKSELVREDHDGEFQIASLCRAILQTELKSPEDLIQSLLPEANEPTLDWEDFAHVAMRDVAERVAAAQKPISILLFGEPGTGKTEFARALAKRIGVSATFAGLADENGNEPDRRDRITHLTILRALCRSQADRMIIVDEADDILAPRHPKHTSKQWVNLLVENPKVPTIWILNDQHELDPAVLRRMTLTIGFERPPIAIRRRIVRRLAQAQNMALKDVEIDSLAALPANAAVVASGLRAACLAGGGAEIAQQVIAGTVKAMGKPSRPNRDPQPVYDPAWSSADADLADLAHRLEATQSPGWSLLLSGPSGTGKSAFARHLAERLGIEVEEVRGSDLLGPYVGDTESRIAGAFARAANREAMLLIDEVDSFLFRRAAAQRSWEVTLVNEMLQQIEHLRMPLVATTNFAEHRDPAVQRRFVMRVEFKAMTKDQVVRLFRARFGLSWPEGEPVPEGQTPGDFEVVARRAALLGEMRPANLLRWLREEMAARGADGGPIGFLLPEPKIADSTLAPRD
jgi:SpoVK/Ycf46/Vps4 family AAA+-type ATPase